MENLFISHLNEKDVDHFTTDLGLFLRRTSDVPFKKLCNLFTNANIIRINPTKNQTDEEYFNNLNFEKELALSLPQNKNNIVLKRYPKLEKGESYIFVANHTCPEDIETLLNIIDRNAYLVLGSIESLKYNPEMYLLWLNGIIPFDILSEKERKELPAKMERVIKTNSILIFPEGSHNYHPNKIVNHLFDGPVNLALKTKKKIVLLSFVKDKEKNIAYVDASNPIDLSTLNLNINDYFPGAPQSEKYYVKALSSFLRDKMATAVYYMMERNLTSLVRENYQEIDNFFIDKYIEDAFSHLKWQHDCFEAEYLVKKTSEDKAYEEVVKNLNQLQYTLNVKKENLNALEYYYKAKDLESKDVVTYMRNYWLETQKEEELTRKLKKVG